MWSVLNSLSIDASWLGLRYLHNLWKLTFFREIHQNLKARGTPLASKLSFNILGTIFGHQKEHQSRTSSRSDEKSISDTPYSITAFKVIIFIKIQWEIHLQKTSIYAMMVFILKVFSMRFWWYQIHYCMINSDKTRQGLKIRYFAQKRVKR